MLFLGFPITLMRLQASLLTILLDYWVYRLLNAMHKHTKHDTEM